MARPPRKEEYCYTNVQTSVGAKPSSSSQDIPSQPEPEPQPDPDPQPEHENQPEQENQPEPVEPRRHLTEVKLFQILFVTLVWIYRRGQEIYQLMAMQHDRSNNTTGVTTRPAKS